MRASARLRFPVALLLAHAAAGLGLAGGVGCGAAPSNPGASCPGAGSVTCPAMPPTYTADVEPILQNRCYGCHGAGGIEQGTIDLTTFHSVSALGSDIATQVGQCIMPPPDAGQLTSQERATLFDWLECGRPN
jgi:uncharacterized membrane protein